MDPIDFSRLREFSDGTPAGLRQLCAMFQDHLDDAAGALRAAVASRRSAALRAEAHKAAGTAGACGARRLSQLLTEMEMLDDAALDRGPSLMQQIDEEIARVHAALVAGLDAALAERSRS